MKLLVLGGAKQGVEIPLKKEKFVIGRASDCTLRAGSDAISRHHCLLLKSDEKVTVRDLGSRNGTFVNERRVEAETPLHHGDELRVGPLKFKFHNEHEAKHLKPPKVKSVADAVARAASLPDEPTSEDDISNWLISGESESKSMMETQSFKLDETRAMGVRTKAENEAEPGDETLTETKAEDEATEASASGVKKGKPGKLPPLPPKRMAKDSREAAADILREMSRRR